MKQINIYHGIFQSQFEAYFLSRGFEKNLKFSPDQLAVCDVPISPVVLLYHFFPISYSSLILIGFSGFG